MSTIGPLTAGEIADLRRIVDRMAEGDLITEAESKIPRLLDEVERSRALLKRIEWMGDQGHPVSLDHVEACPECGALEEEGRHADDCELAALLGGR